MKLTSEQIYQPPGQLIDKGDTRQYIADLPTVGRSTLYRSPELLNARISVSRCWSAFSGERL